MAKRSNLAKLPDDVRRELEAMLIANGFSEYTRVTEWLRQQGFDVSRSAVHRECSKFQKRLESVKRASMQAAEVVKYFPDDNAQLAQATVRMVQSRLIDLLVDEDELQPAALAKITRAIADITRTDIAQRIKLEELRETLKTRIKEIEQSAGKKGASPKETLRRIRELYGLVDKPTA